MSALGLIYFAVCGAIAILAAFGTVVSRTPIRSALSLLAHILSLAALYLSLHAHLLAAIQLIVYAGAVVVLFVFVIMLIGPMEEERQPSSSSLGIARVLSICVMAGVGISIAAAVGGVMPEAPIIAGCEDGTPECSQFGGVRGVANVLYRDAVVPFELISLLLLVAVLGAIAVARGRTIHEGRRRRAQRAADLLTGERERELATQVAASSGQ